MSNHVRASEHQLKLFVSRFSGRSRAGWGWRTGSGPAGSRGGTRWSAGGAGRILTAIIPHRSHTLLFNMWELLKDFNFSSWFHFCPLQDWAHEASNLLNTSTNTVFIFLYPSAHCSMFFVTFGELLWQKSSDHRRSFWGLCEWRVKAYSRCDEMLKFRQVTVICQCKC